MSHRIIVWGTGFVGKSVLRNLLDHPIYEIVAVIVSSDEKDGKDLGEILGIETTGIVATKDSAAALALDADAVCQAQLLLQLVEHQVDEHHIGG